MEILPEDLENVIFGYKKSFDDYEEGVKKVQTMAQDIREDIFTHHLNGKYTDEFRNLCQRINDELSFKMSQEEIYKIIITSGNVDPNIFDWDYVGSGKNHYLKIEDLPRDFVEQFKDYNIRWCSVGVPGILGNYTKIEDLPRDFIEQFQDKIYWRLFGSGYSYKPFHDYTKIEDLPRDFLEHFKDKISWSFVGSGYVNEDKFCNYTKIEDLPRDFVEQFKDKIKWKYVGSGKVDYSDYTKISDLPGDFVEQFKDKINVGKVTEAKIEKPLEKAQEKPRKEKGLIDWLMYIIV